MASQTDTTANHAAARQVSVASRLLSCASFLDQTRANWHRSEMGRIDALTRNLSLWQDLLHSETVCDTFDDAPRIATEFALTVLQRTRDALTNPTIDRIEQLAHLNRELAAYFCAPTKPGW